MKRILFIIALLSGSLLGVSAQDNVEQLLLTIEANNTTLKAYREKASADKIGNKTGINMANPEIEFGYMWGSPTEEGNETDFSIKQSFDFPTAYRYKSQLTDAKNKQVDLVYDVQRRQVLHEARLLYTQLIYHNKLQNQLLIRFERAKELGDSYKKRFDFGDIDIIEYNKTKLNLLNAEKSLQTNEVEINLLKSELQRLNGGEPLLIGLSEYGAFAFPLSFTDWFERIKDNNPSLKISEQEIGLSRKQEQLTKALNLPKISAGYATERNSIGTKMRGFNVGISIPLWEGKNTVKHQKATTMALQMEYEDTKIQFWNIAKSQYDKASKLSRLLQEYNEALKVTSSEALLKKALDKGQLSLINYLLELEAYYDTTDKYLETERDYQLSVAELQQWER